MRFCRARALTCLHLPDSRPRLSTVAIAIALPTSLFLANCFMIANDNEAPESWLEWIGWRKMVFGANAHRKWHYTGPLGQPNRHVKWFIRSVGAPPPETVINLWKSLVSWVTGSDPPWVEEWRETVEPKATDAAEEAGPEHAHMVPVQAAQQENNGTSLPSSQPRMRRLLHLVEQDQVDLHALGNGNGKVQAADGSGDDDSVSTSSSVRSARALARYKHILALSGFIGVYICWAIFAWCVAYACVAVS